MTFNDLLKSFADRAANDCDKSLLLTEKQCAFAESIATKERLPVTITTEHGSLRPLPGRKGRYIFRI